MSTYWDVTCMTCDEGLGLHGNHQEKSAWAIIDAAPRLAAAGAGVFVDTARSFDFFGETNNTIDCGWFAEHAGHDLRPKNEYGKVSGMCANDATCSSCGHFFTCNRDRDHDGDHSPKYDKKQEST